MQDRTRRLKQIFTGVVLSAVLVIFVAASVSASSRQVLWQSRDQFVALEPLEQGADGSNAHPAEIAPETLTSLLASIDVRIEDAKGSAPLFTQESLQALVPQLHQALRAATAKDDVTFAVIGLYSSLYGLAKSPMVTTGRVFRRDGHLNLIIGMAQHNVNEREDRRLAPFVPGSRLKARDGAWQLMPHAGLDFFTLKRKDWIVFSDAPLPVAINQPEPAKNLPSQHTPVAAPHQQTPADTRNPVERLTLLKELRDKGLITEDEYRGKRQQILNGL